MTAILAILLSFALLAAVYVFILVRPARRREMPAALRCDYAHRGLHGGGVPENSLPAFAAAVERGCGIELDIQLSRDGEVMVFHDAGLLRMTGCDRRLSELTRAELSALRLAGTEERIPTLGEVLRLVDGRVALLVELKGTKKSTALCDAAAELLRDYRGAWCCESFNPLLVRGMHRCVPGVFAGQLYSNFAKERSRPTVLDYILSAMPMNFLARPDFISAHKAHCRALPVRIATEIFRVPRFSWTVVGQEEIERAHDQGDYPIFEL